MATISLTIHGRDLHTSVQDRLVHHNPNVQQQGNGKANVVYLHTKCYYAVTMQSKAPSSCCLWPDDAHQHHAERVGGHKTAPTLWLRLPEALGQVKPVHGVRVARRLPGGGAAPRPRETVPVPVGAGHAVHAVVATRGTARWLLSVNHTAMKGGGKGTRRSLRSGGLQAESQSRGPERPGGAGQDCRRRVPRGATGRDWRKAKCSSATPHGACPPPKAGVQGRPENERMSQRGNSEYGGGPGR